MFQKLTIICILAALGLSAGGAIAAFEDVPASPRARAMGEAGSAVVDGAYATYLNPGHLGLTTQGSLAASYVQPFQLDFAKSYHLGAVIPVSPGNGAVGISLNQFKVDYNDVRLMEETQISLAYGNTLYQDMHSRIDLGGTVNMYHLKYAMLLLTKMRCMN